MRQERHKATFIGQHLSRNASTKGHPISKQGFINVYMTQNAFNLVRCKKKENQKVKLGNHSCIRLVGKDNIWGISA